MKRWFKSSVPVAVLTAALFLLPLSETSAEIKSGTDKVSVSLYGQADRAVLYVDDSNQTGTFNVDNDASSSRVGIKAKVSKEDLTVGARWEIEYESDSSAKVNFGDTQQGDRTNHRQMNFYFDKKGLGKITMGHGDTASNGTSEVDLSSTTLVGGADVTPMAASFEFYDNRAKASSGIAIGDVYNHLDGASRKDMIRYDTPSFGGVKISTGYYQDDDDPIHDFALRYSGKMGATKMAAAVSYVKINTTSKDDQMSGSFSILMPMGLNFTVATGTLQYMDPARDETAFTYGKIGYIAKITEIGPTAFSFDYGTYDAAAQNQDEASAYGLQLVQKLSDYSTELYIGYRTYQLDRPTEDYADIMAVMGGARIKF